MMTTTSSYLVLAIITACALVAGVQTITVGNSQYPIYKANRERNNIINGRILCSDLAPGRTTVLNDSWTSSDVAPRGADSTPPIIGQDYFYFPASLYGSDYSIRQYSIAGKSPFVREYYSSGLPTILQDGSLAVSNDTHTFLLTADLAELMTPLTNFDSQWVQIIIPYKSSMLLRPDTAGNAGQISVVDLTNNIANAQWSANITCPGTIRNVMVYSPSSGQDVLVVVTDVALSMTLCVDTAIYTIDEKTNGWATPFIVEGVVHVALNNQSIVRFNLDTKTFGPSIGWDQYYYTQNSPLVRGSKILVSLRSDIGNYIVELVSNTTVLADRKFAGDPTFSIPDNVVVFPTLDSDDNQQLMALDWDTWEVKAIGLFNQLSTGTEMSEAVFDENCNVFVTTGDGIVHKFVPLPISDVVPMLDCVDEFNVAYFSYKNNEQDGFRIPYVADRNALTPDGVAPITSFLVGESQHYPFSTRVQLQNASATYQWRLEDYLLTFSITPQLACPRNVSFTLTFTSTGQINETSFVNLVINALVIVTGVRVERVSVVNVTTQNNSGGKRMIMQGTSTLELELEISAGNSSEPTAADIVTNLVTNQRQDLADQVAYDPEAPAETQLDGVSPKAPAVTPQSGVLTPILPPVAPPTNSPITTDVPQSTPVQVISVASIVMCFESIFFAFGMVVLLL